MQSHTTENYLKAIFNLMNDEKEVNITDLAHSLNVSIPTVNSMVKKMHESGLVTYEKYKPIKMLEAGRRAGAEILRKHRLTEMFLVEKMGFGWEEVHDVAEQIEHIQSELLFDKMDAQLGFPKFDPHGSPIPDKSGELPKMALLSLSECLPGNRVVVRALANTTDDFLVYLNSKSIALGMVFTVKSIESFDRSMHLVRENGSLEIFSEKVSALLLVEISEG